jgi:hypothetical protein
MSDDFPGSRLERALLRVPLIDAEFDALALVWREQAADRMPTLYALPPLLADARLKLSDDHRDEFDDLRLVVTATEPEYLEPIDMTFLRAVALHGDATQALTYFGALMRTHDRTKLAALAFSESYSDLIDEAD